MFLTPVEAAICSADSGKSRVALLELYTAEGCDSCPPTDQWFSGLPQRGDTPQQVLAVAFHIDYWNYLAWKDPYAQARFSTRQRDATRRNQARVVYTPQRLLDGADYRRGLLGDGIGQRIASSKIQAPGAQISMTVDSSGAQPRLRARIAGAGKTAVNAAQAFVAIYENNLVTEVAAGENRGKPLRHDFVVRELYGPLAMTAAAPLLIDQDIRPGREWKRLISTSPFLCRTPTPVLHYRHSVCRGVAQGNQGLFRNNGLPVPRVDDSAILKTLNSKDASGHEQKSKHCAGHRRG